MKQIRTISIIVLSALLLGGCAGGQPQGGPDKLSVYTSVYPMYDFTQKIVGGRANVTSLVPDGAEPHDWEPTPKDIVALEQADVFVYNGAGLEYWVDTVLAGLDNEGLAAVETSAGLALTDAGADDGHDHDHDGHEHGTDPHVWLSPKNAKLQLRAICDAVKAADAENADYYEENYERYAAEFDALDAEYREAAKHLARREIVVSHAAFGYLCREYGLTQVALRGFQPDSEPDPATMAQISDYCRDNGVKAIFFEQAEGSASAEAIAREAGVATEVLSPIESLTDEQRAAGADYLSVMRDNLAAIERALT